MSASPGEPSAVSAPSGGATADRRGCRLEDEVVAEVADDGVGGADPRSGSGLLGLADRVEALGGRLHVDSPPGGGTRVRAQLPCRVPASGVS